MYLAYRWFCGLGLEGPVPDYSTFSKEPPQVVPGQRGVSLCLRRVYPNLHGGGLSESRRLRHRCQYSIITADASRYRGVEGERTGRLDRFQTQHLSVAGVFRRLDEAALAESLPRKMSLTDPATWTAAFGGPAVFAYSTHDLIDLEVGFIVDVEDSTVNKTNEVEAARTMLARVENQFGLKPERPVDDTNYGSATMLAWLVDEKQIAPHVLVWEAFEMHGFGAVIQPFEYGVE